MSRDHLAAVLLIALTVPTALAQQPAAKQAEGSVRVAGRILSVLREGVPAAEVRITDAAGRELGRSVADGDGHFQVAHLPAQPLMLCAGAPGKVDGTTGVQGVREVRAATLVLEDGEPLHGTVVRADGSPAVGAAVCVFAELPLDAPFDWRIETTTDAVGAWHVRAAPLRPLVVRAWAPGLVLQDVAVPSGHAEPVRVVVRADDSPPRSVRVTGVRPGEHVVVRCRLVKFGDRALAQLPSAMLAAKVGADGRASLWPLPVRHEVVVDAPNDACQPVLITCAEHVRGDLGFALTPLPPDLVTKRTRMAGQMVDAEGKPLRGLVLLAKCDDRVSAPATSDEHGRFVLDAPVRTNVLFRVGLAPGSWCLGDPRAELDDDGVTWLTVRADPDAALRLHAVPAGRIRGDLRTTAGVPIAAARLMVVWSRSTPSAYGRFPVASDAAGRLDLVGLPAGGYLLQLLGDRGPHAEVRLDVVAGGEAVPAALALAPTGEVRGMVRGPGGRPAGGVELLVAPVPDPAMPALHGRRFADAAARTILTDREGRFRLPELSEGEWTVHVVVPAMGGRAKADGIEFTVAPGAVAAVDLSLPQ